VLRATGSASLDHGRRTEPFDLAEFPKRPVSASPEPVSRAALEALGELGTLEFPFDGTLHLPVEIDDASPLYEREAIAHPVLLLGAANFALAVNVALGPWIHVASHVQHFDLVRAGARVGVRGRVKRLFEKKGRELVKLDLGACRSSLAHRDLSAVAGRPAALGFRPWCLDDAPCRRSFASCVIFGSSTAASSTSPRSSINPAIITRTEPARASMLTVLSMNTKKTPTPVSGAGRDCEGSGKLAR
jgi:hypothetical protein